MATPKHYVRKALNLTEKLPAITAPIFVALIGAVSILGYRRRGAGVPQQTVRALPGIGLTRELLDDLPRQSYHANGKPMESMNILLFGERGQLRDLFAKAGWYEALPVSIWNLIRAQAALILNVQFLHGPVTPLFVGVRQQALAFQKPTNLNKFKQRHHMRLWSTKYATTAGQPIWIGHASFDVDIKSSGSINRVPVHKIDADIDTERDELRGDLLGAGGESYGYVQLSKPHNGVNAFDDAFETDGRAALVGVAYEA